MLFAATLEYYQENLKCEIMSGNNIVNSVIFVIIIYW